MGSIAALCRFEHLSFKRVCQELTLSWTSAIIVYCACRHFGFSEWMLISLCSVCSYSGSKLLPFFEWFFKSTTVAVAEKKLGVDIDKDGKVGGHSTDEYLRHHGDRRSGIERRQEEMQVEEDQRSGEDRRKDGN